MYLIRAESNFRLNTAVGNTPLNDINIIRTRANATLVSTGLSVADALTAVKNERRIEFCGEGIRWFDLVRWNDWKKAITDKFNRYSN